MCNLGHDHAIVFKAACTAAAVLAHGPRFCRHLHFIARVDSKLGHDSFRCAAQVWGLGQPQHFQFWYPKYARPAWAGFTNTAVGRMTFGPTMVVPCPRLCPIPAGVGTGTGAGVRCRVVVWVTLPSRWSGCGCTVWARCKMTPAHGCCMGCTPSSVTVPQRCSCGPVLNNFRIETEYGVWLNSNNKVDQNGIMPHAYFLMEFGHAGFASKWAFSIVLFMTDEGDGRQEFRWHAIH